MELKEIIEKQRLQIQMQRQRGEAGQGGQGGREGEGKDGNIEEKEKDWDKGVGNNLEIFKNESVALNIRK